MTRTRPLAVATAVLALGLGLTACADEGTSTTEGAADPNQAKVAFLMPDLASTRYELYDAPLFEAKMEELCPDCEVIYQNADSDPTKQQDQANSALAQGAAAIVLDRFKFKPRGAFAQIGFGRQFRRTPPGRLARRRQREDRQGDDDGWFHGRKGVRGPGSSRPAQGSSTDTTQAHANRIPNK